LWYISINKMPIFSECEFWDNCLTIGYIKGQIDRLFGPGMSKKTVELVNMFIIVWSPYPRLLI
jgi:hypothetical protein